MFEGQDVVVSISPPEISGRVPEEVVELGLVAVDARKHSILHLQVPRYRLWVGPFFFLSLHSWLLWF